MGEFRGLVIPDVIDSEWSGASCGVWGLVIPVGVRCGDLVHQWDHCVDDIVDVGEVPFHFTFVEDIDWFTFEDGFREFEQCHIGSSPETVNGEEA